jgi:hypothetical protein
VLWLLDSAPDEQGHVTVGTAPLEDLISADGDALPAGIEEPVRRRSVFAAILAWVAQSRRLGRAPYHHCDALWHHAQASVPAAEPAIGHVACYREGTAEDMHDGGPERVRSRRRWRGQKV